MFWCLASQVNPGKAKEEVSKMSEDEPGPYSWLHAPYKEIRPFALVPCFFEEAGISGREGHEKAGGDVTEWVNSAGA